MTYEEVKKLLEESERWKACSEGYENKDNKNIYVNLSERRIRLVIHADNSRCATSCRIEELQERENNGRPYLHFCREDAAEEEIITTLSIWL